ncbi:MAG: LacI family DNA-binding transcriptional regulator [Gaiellaceae bacterium]
MTTIVDVARKAGVSISTVSRVLNGNGHVDPVLATKVTRAAKQLNYSPNRVARSLRLRTNRVWALVISDIRTGPFFADVVRGVEDGAHESGYSMFLCNTDEDPSKEAGYLQLAVAENVAGVILEPSGTATDLGPLLNAGIHVVLVDRKLPGAQTDTVVADNIAGAQQAVEHLLENGYRRIACISGPLSTTTGSERLAGYRMALERASLPVEDSLIRVADFREEGGHRAIDELLAEETLPDAVFITNNRMTAGALEAIEEARLTVPDEIAVVGYDEISWAPLLRTALTTVSQPAYDLGHESARLLLSRLDGYSGSARTVVLRTSLNIRASSAPRRADSDNPSRAGVATGSLAPRR